MNNEQIEELLEKAVLKAIKNGFRGLDKEKRIEVSVVLEPQDQSEYAEQEKEIAIVYDWDMQIIDGKEVECEPWCCGKRIYFGVEELLFDHEFIKSVWDKKEFTYRLRALALRTRERRFEYLRDYLIINEE